MTASLPCMQWLVVPTPRRPPAVASSIRMTPGCHCSRRPGVVRNSQATAGGASVGTLRP